MLLASRGKDSRNSVVRSTRWEDRHLNPCMDWDKKAYLEFQRALFTRRNPSHG